jgi:hypothetical protein
MKIMTEVSSEMDIEAELKKHELFVLVNINGDPQPHWRCGRCTGLFKFFGTKKPSLLVVHHVGIRDCYCDRCHCEMRDLGEV